MHDNTPVQSYHRSIRPAKAYPKPWPLWKSLLIVTAFIVMLGSLLMLVEILYPEPDPASLSYADSVHPMHEFSQVSRHQEVMIFEATAYCHTGNQTATSTWPEVGRTVAVDPKVIPLGSHLIINGVSGYVAEDIGGLVKGRIIDIYMASEHEALQFGRRPVEVELKGENSK